MRLKSRLAEMQVQVEKRNRECEQRLEAIEERQKFVEEMLDEALSKWDLVQQVVKKLESYRKNQIEVTLKSEMGKEYTEAYLAWYSGDYKRAIRELSAFIAKHNDRYLKQQAQMLLADSYARIGKRRSACQVLRDFISRYPDSVFLCAAYYKAKKLYCRVKGAQKRCLRRR